MGKREVILLLLLHICGSFGQNDTINDDTAARNKKAFAAFQFVKFPNDACNGGTRNGTCYTSDECLAKGGTSSGTCANGFGVCCLFVLGCGSSSSANNTYLVQQATTGISGHFCKYSICKTSQSICRIRLDFTTFVLAPPVEGQLITDVNTVAPIAVALNRNNVGHCNTDTFVVTVSGAKGSPEICGFNTGQHMIVDAGDANCINVNFMVGGPTTTTRNWDIKVTQYDCGDLNGGPQGCLQYFTGVSKTFGSFNFPLTTTLAQLTDSITHLINQNYDICIRRESGFCYICYQAAVQDPANINVGSFGLSVNPNILVNQVVQASTQNSCSADYLSFNGVSTRAIVLMQPPGDVPVTRVCGRLFGSGTVQESVCTYSVPFKMTFVTDNTEGVSSANIKQNEEYLSPTGTRGFLLTYTQLACGTAA